MNPVRDKRWFMYQQRNFLYLNFHYKSLTDRDDAFYMFNGKVLCRAKLFSWDGRYVKENQPHLEEILASPLFSLEKSFLSPAPSGEMFESPENICRHCCSPSHKEGQRLHSAVCYEESCIFKNF